MTHCLPKLVLVLCGLLSSFSSASAQRAAAAPAAQPAPPWQELSPGLAYKELTSLVQGGRSFQLHCFRVSLAHYRMAVLDARSAKRRAAPVKELAQEAQATLAINGTFFDERYQPLGLLIHEGQQRNPLRRADWGVFFVQGQQAHLEHTRAWRQRWQSASNIRFAIQVGPRLVASGKPLRLKPQTARRSLLGLLADGQVVVAANAASVADANDLAELAARAPATGGLGCQEALLLDGGPSTQLYARQDKFLLDVPGGWGVPNAVGFIPRGTTPAKTKKR